MNSKEQPMEQPEESLEYNERAEEAPPRDVDMPTNALATTEHGSLSQQVDTPDMSDMQAAVARLFPVGVASPSSSLVMVSRIEPDAFLALLSLMATEEYMVSDPSDVNFVNILQKCYSLLSIGRDGMGRIDLLELAGAARDDKKLQTMANLGG